MMIKLAKIIRHPFFSGSMVMVVGSNAVNVLNYLYHPLMARLLGPESYGELASLISLLGLLLLLPMALGLVVTKFVSSSNDSQRAVLIRVLNKWNLRLGLLPLMVIGGGSFWIADFLKLSSQAAVVILGVIIFLYLPMMVVRASLQGLLRFKELVASLICESSLKIIVGVILVSLSFGVNGSLVGFGLATLVTLLIFQSRLKLNVNKNEHSEVDFRKLFKFSGPVLVQSLAIGSFYSTDLILVKHFFSLQEAGVYAALSILSRIIFFGSSPITMVSFPMIAKKYARKEKVGELLALSVLSVAVICLLVVLVFWLFPAQVISLPYGPKYLSGVGLLALFGVSISFLAISNLLSNFLLAIGREKITGLLAVGALIQGVGIWFWHGSLLEVIMISAVVLGIVLGVLGGYSVWVLGLVNRRDDG